MRTVPPVAHPIAIHKFGGAALTDSGAIRHVGALLSAPVEERRVAVTSALQGVTDSLLRAVHCATEGDASGASAIARELAERHTSVASALTKGKERKTVDSALASLADTLVANLAALAHTDADRAQLRDAILAHGERAAAQIVSGMLRSNGAASVVVDATLLVETDGRYGNAALLSDRSFHT